MLNRMRLWLIVIVVLAMFIGATTPAMAAVQGQPDLLATLVGSQEFPVGQPGALQVMVQNKGTFTGEVQDPNDQVMAYGYLTATGVALVPPCTTAVSATATLKSDTTSIQILSGTAAIGSLPRGMSTVQPLAFQIQIAKDARPGTYDLGVELKYQYLDDVRWLNPESPPPVGYVPQFAFNWADTVQREIISVTVVGTYFSATVTQSEGIRAAQTGIITVNIQNGGTGKAYDVTAEIVPGSSLSPIGPASFLGDLGGGNAVTTQFKIAVSKDAITKSSPLDILIKYKDERKISRQTQLTVGIQVAGDLKFEIQAVRVEGDLTPGAQRIISIPITNVSDYQVKDTIARINIVDPFSTAPFSTTDDTAYIGTLGPGQTGIAKFKISVDSDAVPKAYTLEVEVKYWDSLGNSYMSKPMTAVVVVQPSSGPSVGTIILIAAIVLAIIFIVFLVMRRGRATRS